ncbi:hypothetical protein KA005_07390 [bacterium]|nr:hypothetical protein [bacterium]
MDKEEMILLIDPNDPELSKKIKNLKPTYGFCIFIDIVGSTELKDEGLSKWIMLIYNTFANINSFLFSKFQPIKSIGDALMYFISESEMKEETPLTLYDALVNIINSNEPYFKKIKIGVTYCKEAYNITFIKDNKDIYGKDIDLTARLASIAESQEIIMNSDFVKKIRDEYDKILNKHQFPDVPKIVGPWPQKFKGFKDKVEIFKTIGRSTY